MTARRVLPWVWVALVSAIFLGELAVDLPGDFAARKVNVFGLVSEAMLGFAFPAAGALILSRDPRHPVGWILSLNGLYLFASGLDGILDGYLTGTPLLWSGWFSQIFFPPSFLALITLLPLLFPTGRLLSPRWRWALWCALIGLAGLTLANAVNPDLLEGGLRNPAGGPGGAELYENVVMPIAGAFFVLAVVASLASLVVRYRRATGDERQQLRWLVLAMTVSVGGWFVAIGLEAGGSKLGSTVFVTTLVSLPIAIAVAVLKYRLYDIDVVISRTVVFGGLAAFITAIYVGIVVGVGTLLGAGGEPNLALSIVATAVVAVAFQPVRERLTRLANRLVFGRRATPYEVLSRFSSHLGDTVATEDTLAKMARLLADGTGAAHAQVSLAIGGQMVPAASVGQVADASADAHTVEVTHQGQVLGALSVTKKRGETLTPADIKLVDDLAAQAGLLLRNVRLTEELKARIVDLRASRQRLVAAQDAERRRLERDLHDGAQQQIVAMKLKLGIAKTLAQKDNAPRTVGLVEQLMSETDEAVQTLRELAHGIYPPLLAAEGLEAAISTAARRAPVPVAVEADGVGRYGQDVEAAVYFCVLEAITNAAKYANPTQVTIRLAQTDGQLVFEVTDDGTGFDPTTTKRGHGLTNMTDRLDALEGHLEMMSSLGNGTRASGTLPVAVREVTR